MVKNNNLCIDLKTVMQNATLLEKGKCYTGILSRIDEEHYLFEESIRKGRNARNPKLFDGDYISLTRQMNGKYQLHLKTLDAQGLDASKYAFNVYGEILNALKVMDA